MDAKDGEKPPNLGPTRVDCLGSQNEVHATKGNRRSAVPRALRRQAVDRMDELLN
jgi:hypothetical protein